MFGELAVTATEAVRRSTNGDKLLYIPVAHSLVQDADGVLVEVRRAAMKVERGVVRILLVDEHGVGLSFDEVSDVANAARLQPRVAGELDEGLLDVVLGFGRKTP